MPVETTGKQSYERRDRDDEEEWGGIPIPQSDDSQSSGDYLSDDTEEEEDESASLTSRQRSDDLAFLLAPRLDGKIKGKKGLVIDLNEPTPNIKNTSHQETQHHEREPAGQQPILPPQWTKHIFAYQRYQLRKGYRKITTKIHAKHMKQVHKKIRDTATMKQRAMAVTSQHHTLVQCMNALQSPTRTNKHQRSPVKRSPPNNLPKRSKHRFSPITVPGTPDHQK